MDMKYINQLVPDFTQIVYRASGKAIDFTFADICDLVRRETGVIYG